MKEALLSTGLNFYPDVNNGDPNGVAQLVENCHETFRQHAAICYELKGIHLMTNIVVQRVLLHGNKATGVELTDGQRLTAFKEVIVSCGALRHPQLLKLSGIRPKSELFKYNIQQIAELPVGRQLHDHGFINIIWRLQNPDKDYAFGSPAFNKPEYAISNPMD